MCVGPLGRREATGKPVMVGFTLEIRLEFRGIELGLESSLLRGALRLLRRDEFNRLELNRGTCLRQHGYDNHTSFCFPNCDMF